MEYRKLDKMNQSLLKQILKHPVTFLQTQEKFIQKLENEEQGIIEKIPDHFLFGTLVDHMLTEDTPLEDKFYIMKSTKLPSDAIVEIVNLVFNEYASTSELSAHETAILEASARMAYGQSWKPETLVKKIVEAGSDYFLILQESANKIIISQEDYNKAVMVRAALKSDAMISPLLNSSKSVELIKKPVFEFSYKGIDFKGEGDLISVIHSLKEIHPIDIKTMSGHIYQFENNFWSYRYDFQGAFYTKGIESYPRIKELLAEGYKLMPFKFIVADKECMYKPMIFTMSHSALQVGINGGIVNGKQLEGIKQAIERYTFHKENNKWDYPMEYYINSEMFIEV